jgi:hypothetical protein
MIAWRHDSDILRELQGITGSEPERFPSLPVKLAIDANGEWPCATRMNILELEVADIGLHRQPYSTSVDSRSIVRPGLCLETPLGLEIKLPIIGGKTFVHSSSMVLSFAG